MGNYIGDHRFIVESSSKRKLIKILAIIGALAIVFTVAFAIYRHFTKQDYIDDFDDDFDDDYDDDFNDDFFMDADDGDEAADDVKADEAEKKDDEL